MTMLQDRPNVQRRAILMTMLMYAKVEIQRENDPRLKPFMGLVELGELMVTEMHASAPGVIHRRFVLTIKGAHAAGIISKL